MPKQKIAIKVSLASDRSRARAMELVSRSQGVMSIGITGDGMEVIGEGMDAVRIVRRLRRKIGRAEILVVEPVSEEEEKYLDLVKLFVQQQPYHPTNFSSGGGRYQYPPYPPPPLPRLVYPEHNSCTIL